MKKLKYIFAGIAFMVMPGGASAQQQTLFDAGWQFTREGKTITVDLPHDWDIYCAPTKEAPMGNDGGYYPGGVGEYRKTFATPDAERVCLHFEGVYQQATVMVNGQMAGLHGYGYTPFTVDVTPYLYAKAEKRLNEVVVRVDNSQQPNCRWYSGSGIYRHVWLQTGGNLFLSDETYITTPEVSAEKALVDITPFIENHSGETRNIDSLEVRFSGGQFYMTEGTQKAMEAPSFAKSKSVGPGHRVILGRRYAIEHPRLWSPDDPYLYEVTILLREKGKVVDEQHLKFGIRSFSFDAGQGFLLNGKPIKLNGACVHHDDGVLGAMAFDAAEIRKVRLMKEAGFNLIRTSHNPSTRAFLDACDSLGMLVIDEAFDGWRTQKTAHDYHEMFDSCSTVDIASMALRDRNHPSIICWSIGNEVIERKDIRVVTTARQLKKALLGCDNTRPVTEALCAWDRDWEIYDPHAEVLDVVGYNYMMFKHATDHERDPQRVMWQTESYPRDAFLNWQRTTEHPYIVGDIVWTGLDYLGESGIGRYYYEGQTPGEHYQHKQFPWHGAYCGDVDITGWRKPISHYRDMLWNDVKQPYIAVKEPDGYHGKIKETQWSVWPTWESWNWAGWEGKPIEGEVYTKEPQVTLYLNDQLIGTKAVSKDTEYKAVFTLPYEPGILRAEASGKDAILCTAGEPARLRLTPDRCVITADGKDLAYITLEVVDKDGNVVPDAAVPCNVSVSGRAHLMAAASADLTDLEPMTSSKVTTWKGRAIIVVRSQQRPGSARISASSTLPTASLTLKTK